MNVNEMNDDNDDDGNDDVNDGYDINNYDE